MTSAQILIVEDDRIVARDIAQQMKRAGHVVVGSTGSGEEALALIDRLPADSTPDLVLMDVRLEGELDGIDTARRIRETRDVPVVFLTAYADEETIRRATAAEPYGYVLKPFDDTQLRTIVEMALYKHGAERRLRESEQRYAITLSSIGDGVVSTDADGFVTFVNPAGEALTGWPRSEATGQRLREIFLLHDEDTGARIDDPATAVLQSANAGGLPARTLLRKRDGSDLPVECTATPMTDERGARLGVVIVFRDVTQKRRAQEAEILRETNARLEMAMYGSNVGVWEIDMPEGDYKLGFARYSNIYEWLGFDAPQARLDYEAYMSVLHPDHRASTDHAVASFLESGDGVFELENRLRHRDGSDRWVLVRGTARRDATGKPVRFVGSLVDITQLKATEQALRASEERFRGTFENAAVGVAHCDLDGRFLRVNHRSAEIVGWPRAELQRRRLHELIHDCFIVASIDRFRQLKEGKVEHYSEEVPLVRGDGSRVWVTLSVALQQDASGQTSHVIVIIQDISARKALEETVRVAKDAAEAANRAKDQFLANISHELRTPLNGILGYAQMLQRDARLDTRQRASVDVIEQSGQHLLTLINDILDFARLGAGKLELQVGEVSLRAFLATIAEIVAVRAQQKRLALNYVAAADLPAVVRVDERRLRQVLLNLLANAVKFTDHGTVTLSVRRCASGRVRFEVRDTGIGVSADRLEAIFQPFEQAGDHTRRSGGAGLGLAISRQLVRMMGGDIDVASSVGEGSVFGFELDAPASAVEPDACAPRVPAGSLDGARRVVLVVDDVPANRALLADLLGRVGFNVIESSDGRDALERAAACAPELIILDTVMPLMGGIETLRHLRRSKALSATPVIVVSADASEQNARANLDAGASVFLEKPLDLDRLLSAIATLLDGMDTAQRAATSCEADPPLIVPPHEEMTVLHRHALRGSMRDITRHADRLATLHEKYEPFAARLRQLATTYESQALLSLIEHHLKNEGN
ncbi:hybrid sensor histidine kinase/response regulator [Burkholderia territorii]|uniref:Virulence sensor protein BvgS n=1 Tax=Burkholderia territorii TaxID=1503055 RepID=A0A119AMF5_9BURK|nr:PAS domain S-box protein [Burkholderia territorii]KVV37553.1 hybrid sensor histidine kinase/response regulator [Burkholderia territorii]KVX36983.1 hybrid sensor histidine kinase/response regulator [Burkholderia territorii]